MVVVYRRQRALWLSVLMILSSLLGLPGVFGPVVRAAANIGYVGPSTAGAGNAPTGDKPESKLWWHAGWWWASLWHSPSGDFHIYRLDLSTQTWIDTGVPLDPRPNSRADVLWDGSNLYVASHLYSTSTGPASSADGAKLWRFSYDAGAATYRLDAGFPVNINAARSETLVIDKDSTGKLWAVWVQQTSASSGVYKVFVNRTLGDDAQWGTPFELPVSGASVARDDIAAVIAFDGNKIGVMWSNQIASAMYFAVHLDGDPDTTWQASRTAIQGPNNADDHINLKSLQTDGSGRVFAAVKTSHTSSSAPLIMLLVLDRSSGDWQSYVYGRVADHHTRPIVLLDSTNQHLYMYATADENGGSIYEKSAPINALAFAGGLGTPFIEEAATPGTSGGLNNATSTKQPLNCTTGLVVLASNDTTDRYWHNYRALPGCTTPAPPAPPANLQATPGDTRVELRWEAVNGASSYSVKRSTSSGGPYTTLASGLTGTTYVDTTVSNGIAFYYVVTALNSAGESAPSNEVSATPQAPPPPPAGENLLRNAGFENDTNNDGRPDDWSTNSRVSRSSALVHSGAYAMRHAATDNGSYTITQHLSGVSPATTYTFSGWINIPPTSDSLTFRFQVQWRNASNSTIATTTVQTFTAPTAGWTVARATLTPPTGTAAAQVRMAVSSLNATIYVDDLFFGVAGSAPDTTPPSITATSPPSDAGSVALSATISATFSEAMDPATITPGSFTLVDATTTVVPAAVSYDATTRTATLDPNADLAPATTYTARLDGTLTDTSGNALAPYSWSFTTATADGGGSTASLPAVADAFVRDGSYAGQNFGTAPTLEVKASGTGYNRQTYLRFDLSAVNASHVDRALLKLTVTALPNGAGAPLRVFAVLDDTWSETTITWNNRPAPAATALSTVTIGATGQIVFDVTSLVSDELAADRRLSLVISEDAGANKQVNLASREASTNRPVLELSLP